MKTLKQVCINNPEYSKLIRAVVRRIGYDSIADVNAHGIDGGFSGFVYHQETGAFFRKHRHMILKLACEMAGNLGESLLSMIRGFRCVGPDYSEMEIGQVIYSERTVGVEDSAVGTIQNGMAWFAAEEVCRMFED